MAAEARRAPAHLPTQYLYAVILGVRTEIEGGSSQVSKAKELHGQIQTVLALDPQHPGAMHLLGRLNAAVMRLGRLKRFIATRILGAGVLSTASWREARHLLEAAADGDPCVPEHHFELARLYAERGFAELALDRLARLDILIQGDDARGGLVAKARKLEARLRVSVEGGG